MTDYTFSTDVVPHAHAAVAHAKHVVHVAPQIIKQGYSMLTLILSNVVTAIVFGVGAWYVRGRGLNGVQIDLNNIKADVEKIKAQLFPVAPATPVA